MSRTLIEAFFTVTDAERQIGYAIQGTRVARWDWGAGKALDADAALLSRRWPQLPEAFTEGFDATMTVPGDDPWTWVFRGERCLRLNPLDGTVAEVGTISARFPGLPAVFTAGLDAALPSLSAANRAYLFRGDQCAQYDLRASNLIEVKSLADTWSGLAAKAPEFVAGINAATYNPKTGSCYLFRGEKYTRGALSTRVIDLNAGPVDNASWPGLVPAFARGHVIVFSPGYVLKVDLESHAQGQLDWLGGPGWIEPSPDGRYMHVARWSGSPRWSCYDMTTWKEVASSNAYSFMDPQRMAFRADGTRAYFVTPHHPAGNVLRVVGLNPPALLSTIPLDGGTPQSDPAEEPDGGAESASGAGMSVATETVPPPVVAAPNGRYVYAGLTTVQDGRAFVYEVDLVDEIPRQVFALPGQGPIADLAISADGRILHVALASGVCALDLLTGEIVLQGKLPACTAMALTPDKRELWCVPAARHSGILVVDPADHHLVRRIPIGGRGGLGTAKWLLFSHFGTYAYSFDWDSQTVAVIDAGCYRKVASPSVSANFYGSIAFTQY
ncbi:hypothetical protein [Embleya sp. AB8]|uniref:hypothetical protein n=1 Tax=Embleya sp. AB8 TaxID=3156304 RepID=UPI003C7426D7